MWIIVLFGLLDYGIVLFDYLDCIIWISIISYLDFWIIFIPKNMGIIKKLKAISSWKSIIALTQTIQKIKFQFQFLKVRTN